MKLVTIWCLLCSICAQGQATRYRFKVRYEDYTPFKNAVIIINNQTINTDDNGVADLNVAAQLGFAYVESADSKKYQVKYPVESRAILPKDPQIFIDVIIAKPDVTNLATRQDIAKLRSEITTKNAAMDTAMLQVLESQSRRLYDSIAALFSTASLDNSKLLKGRLEFYPLISGALNQYLNETRDLNAAFNSLAMHLTTKEAYEQFIQAIYSYNTIFEFLNTNKNTYEQAIAIYWNSKELGYKFSNIIDEALENIHKPYILEMNFSFIERLYQMNHELNKKKRATMQQALQEDMSRHAAELARRLNSLGERITSLNAILNNNSG